MNRHTEPVRTAATKQNQLRSKLFNMRHRSTTYVAVVCFWLTSVTSIRESLSTMDMTKLNDKVEVFSEDIARLNDKSEQLSTSFFTVAQEVYNQARDKLKSLGEETSSTPEKTLIPSVDGLIAFNKYLAAEPSSPLEQTASEEEIAFVKEMITTAPKRYPYDRSSAFLSDIPQYWPTTIEPTPNVSIKRYRQGNIEAELPDYWREVVTGETDFVAEEKQWVRAKPDIKTGLFPTGLFPTAPKIQIIPPELVDNGATEEGGREKGLPAKKAAPASIASASLKDNSSDSGVDEEPKWIGPYDKMQLGKAIATKGFATADVDPSEDD